MKTNLWIQWAALLLAGCMCIASGCSDSDESPKPDSNPDDGSGAPSQPKTVTCLVMGDGLTKGVGLNAGDPWPALLKRRLSATVAVDAHGGVKVDRGAGMVQKLIDLNDPSHVLILLGTNDVAARTPLNEMEGHFQTMVDTIRRNKAIPILATLPPLYGFDEGTIDHWKEVNGMIRSFASANKVRLARLDKEFGTDRSLILADGIHPSANGHVLIMAASYDLL